MAKAKTTTRSYTLRLDIPNDVKADAQMCRKVRVENRQLVWQRLFETHLAVCNGSRVYGELLLNLRGGLSAELAVSAANNDAIAVKKGRTTKEQNQKSCVKGTSEVELINLETADKRRFQLVLRGARRMLSLGWLSVEDMRASESHPHKIKGCNAGSSLESELAKDVLASILKIKGVPETEWPEWIADCVPALTARIRNDAVWVNRAAAFLDWQNANVDVEALSMVGHAESILTRLCGADFISLNLPEDELPDLTTDGSDMDDGSEDSEDSHEKVSNKEDDLAPSNASRGIFGDLFGGDAEVKKERAKGKEDFTLLIAVFLRNHRNPTKIDIDNFRSKQNYPPINSIETAKFPTEVSWSGAPTTIAKRYRKLLVSLKLWPIQDDEDGEPRKSADDKFQNELDQNLNADARKVTINSSDLLDACSKGDEEICQGQASKCVFTPPWAQEVARRVAKVTSMPVDSKVQNEFKRLMFALAARRLSQTQTWTRLNELTRHNAAFRVESARQRLVDLDPKEHLCADLVKYELNRGVTLNAKGDFFITKRMIGDCVEVMSRWESTTNPTQRIECVAKVQENSEKFGDADFYAKLAESDLAGSRWSGSIGSDVLIQWARLRKAEDDQRRGKVPRYCHPDAFHHPTWVEFGDSSKPPVWYQFGPNGLPSGVRHESDADGLRRMWLRLTDRAAETATAVELCWRSKRLASDLGNSSSTLADVPRADRLCLAAAKLPQIDTRGVSIGYRPRGIFLEGAKGWNARLQLDRQSLKALEKQWDKDNRNWIDGGKTLRNSPWFVTFAPSLSVAPNLGSIIHPKLGWKSSPHTEINKKQKRGGNAKLILSRLPGLRILSVDLGHRYAAACAVWEAISSEQMVNESKKLNHRAPTSTDLYLHLKCNADPKKSRTTIYRRIGADTIKDSATGKVTPHPAPWARLERQFLIKLPGEQQQPRAASSKDAHGVNELQLVETLAKQIGQVVEDDANKKDRSVHELMARAVRLVALGLKRHARRAKIAYAFDPATKVILGMGASEKEFTEGDSAHIGVFADALIEWHSLATDAKWNDKRARNLWNQHVSTIAGGWTIEDPKATDEVRTTSKQRTQSEDSLRLKMAPIAQQLVKINRSAIHNAWKERWESDNGRAAKIDKATYQKTFDGTGFHASLRWVTDWIMGKNLIGATGDGWKQNVGGLSVTRITTMKALYQLHKAFAMRATPLKPRGAPEKGESNIGIAQSILIAMERMRDQRVKQIASRIAGSALGLGGQWVMRDIPANKAKNRSARTKLVWLEDLSPKYSPCHAVVIENLKNYRPDEMRTRRENSQLMSWASSKVEKYLGEACQLNGLHLRSVSAGYTSRQDSRTGAPGIRCCDVSVKDFQQKPWWRKSVEAAKQKNKEGKGNALDRYLENLDKQYPDKSPAIMTGMQLVRIPVSGGDLFVSADESSPAAKGLQADLNAAANIGLKALLDPDWEGKWWFVPCASVTNTPVTDKVKGSQVISNNALIPIVQGGTKPARSKVGNKERDVVNIWRDPSSLPIKADGNWFGSAEYWNKVRIRVIQVIQTKNNFTKLTSTQDTPW